MNDLSGIRESFPFFRMNPGITYLDYAATTFMPDPALDAWLNYQKNVGISEGRNNSRLGMQSTAILRKARAAIKSFFKCDESHELIFVKNATEALNLIAWGLNKYVQAGEIIILSALEHHSNYLPWQRLASQHEAQLVELPLVGGLPDMDTLEEYLQGPVRVISITHTSNVTGAQPDIGKIVKVAARTGAFTVLDASQAAGHGHLRAEAFQFDCVALSAHKMYGPKNIGGLFIKKSLLPVIEPFILGGGMVWRAGSLPAWRDDHHRLEAGTFDPGLALAWEESCKFLETIGLENIAREEKETGMYLRRSLSGLGMRLIGNTADASPAIVSFMDPELHAHDLEEHLSKAEIIIRSGHLCAQNALRHLDVQAINRVSIGLGVDKSQIERLLEVLSGHLKISFLKEMQSASQENFLEKLVNERKARLVIAPDFVLVSDGLACGDSVILEATNSDGKCTFNCSVTGCLYCSASAAFMEKLNGLPAVEISNHARDFINFIESKEIPENFPLDLKEWLNWNYPESRKECILAPWHLLAGMEWKCEYSSKASNEQVPFACDACITANKIVWSLKQPHKKSGLCVRLFKLAKLIWQLDNKRDVELQALARVQPREKERLAEWLTSGDFASTNLAVLKSLKIAAPIYNNLVDNLSGSIPPDLQKLITSLRMRKIVLDREYARIMEVIASHKWEIIPVKGAVTSSLYSKRHLRAHLDYDFVALSGRDAFKLAAWLIQHDFHFICTGSVPLSVRIDDKDGREFSGHFHLEKILYDKYQMVVDFNFPGFPSGRNSCMPCVIDEAIKWEQQFVITLCHAFKHDRVYIKDINDIVKMVNEKLIKLDNVYQLIHENSLHFYFTLLAKFIFNNYRINIYSSMKIHSSILLICDTLIVLGWPYSRKAHLYAKCVGELSYIKTKVKQSIMKYFKKENYTLETDSFPLHKGRLYLFPLIVFNKHIEYDGDKLNQFKYISDGTIHIIRRDNMELALVPIGIFMVSSSNTVIGDRGDIARAVEELLNIFGIKNSDISHGSIREARKDLWLF